MAKVINFDEFKTKQMHKNSANLSALAQTNEIDDDLDLSDDWDNAGGKNISVLHNTLSKLFRAIFTSKIKKS